MSQVVIGDILPYTQATAILNQTVFGTNWTANVASDVVVYQTPAGDDPNDVTQVLPYPAGYSVAFIGGSQQVQVTLVTPAGAGDIITITRQTPADRENLYTNTNFVPSMLNNDFGILTLVDQQAQLVDQKIGPRYNYSATILDVIDTILPILPANYGWVKNNANTAIIPYLFPSSGIAPAGDTYITYTDETSDLPNSYRLLAGTNVSLVPGANTLTINMVGQSINPGLINDLAYYAASGTTLSPLATANNGVLVTSAGGIPSISSTLPNGLIAGTMQLGAVIDSLSQNVVTFGSAGAGANNYINFVNGINPGAPIMEAAGAGTDVQLIVKGKGTSAVFIQSETGTSPLALTPNVAGNINSLVFDIPTITATRTATWRDSSGTVAYLSDIPVVVPSALTKTDDTNVTLSLSGTPSTALLQAVGIAAGWTGQLSLARGGTNNNLTAANGAIPYSDATKISLLAAGTSGQLFQSGGAGAPNWTTTTYPTTNAINTIMYASSANVLGVVTPVNSAVMISSAGGVPSMSTTLPAGLTIPGYQPTITGQALTRTDDTNVTLTLGGTPASALLSATSLTLGWTGTLSVARGGTGVGSVTTSPTASAFAGWDANRNMSADSFIAGYTTTATAAGTTTLTVNDTYQQYFTGATTQTVVLPVTSTLVLGQSFLIVNNSSGVVTVQSSGANTIQAMAASTTLLVTCISTSGTGVASWSAQYLPISGSGIVNAGTTNQLAYYAANGTTLTGLATANNGVLTTDGSGVPSITALNGLGILASLVKTVKRQVITGTGTYTPSAGLIAADVEGVGGGGGSGGVACSAANSASSGAGGGGGYFRKLYTAAEIGASASVTIGAAGAAGSAGNNNGTAGGNTVFDPAGTGVTCTGNGGALGQGCPTQGANGVPANSGLGGTASGGDINITGGDGYYPVIWAFATGVGMGGKGGDSQWGHGGEYGIAAAGSIAGTGYGAGGGGAFLNSNTTAAGAAGTIGLVVVTEYCNQ